MGALRASTVGRKAVFLPPYHRYCAGLAMCSRCPRLRRIEPLDRHALPLDTDCFGRSTQAIG
jgi:hypothetical protein